MAADLYHAKLGYLKDYRGLLEDVVGVHIIRPMRNLQAQIAKRFKPHLVACEVAKVFPIRLCSANIPCGDFNFSVLHIVFRGLTRRDALCAHRLLSNSPNTTWRMHEAIRFTGVFGRNGALGEFKHYICCPVLLSVVPFVDIHSSSFASWVTKENIKK